MFSWRDPAHPRGGGAEVYTHEILRRWAAQGHDVSWFCAAVDDRPETEVCDGITMIRRGSRLSVYREAKAFYHQQTERYDLVIDQVNTRPFFCHEWVTDAPVVALVHQVAREVWFHELPLPIAAAGRYVFEPNWLGRYRYVPTISISESSRESLLAYGFQRVLVSPPAIPAPPMIEVHQREVVPTLAFVGRLAANKRPGDAIEALIELRLRRPDAQLWVVGEGPDRRRLERIAPPGVRFVGHVDQRQKYELMARAHALVATSTREGWGMVVTEAASVGTRSVAYDVAGLRDSVGLCAGRLCPADPVSLAEAVDDVLDEWMRTPPNAQICALAGDWDEVAAGFLGQVTDMCAVSPQLVG